MELLQLRYFVSAAETENFSKTAKEYLVPPSNISQTVKRLEKELGCTLFERSVNKITLNKEGKQFYDAVKKALAGIDGAKDALDGIKNEIGGEIKLSICADRRLVTTAIQRFTEKYPSVSFIISHREMPDSDIIISDTITSQSGYTKQLLTEEEILLASSKELNLKQGNDTENAKVLENLNYITMPSDTSLYRYTKSICEKYGFEPDITIITDDPFYIRKYVEMGLGAAFVPAVSWQGQFDKSIKFYSVGNTVRYTYVYRKNTCRSDITVREFCKCLLEETQK